MQNIYEGAYKNVLAFEFLLTPCLIRAIELRRIRVGFYPNEVDQASQATAGFPQPILVLFLTVLADSATLPAGHS